MRGHRGRVRLVGAGRLLLRSAALLGSDEGLRLMVELLMLSDGAHKRAACGGDTLRCLWSECLSWRLIRFGGGHVINDFALVDGDGAVRLKWVARLKLLGSHNRRQDEEQGLV